MNLFIAFPVSNLSIPMYVFFIPHHRLNPSIQLFDHNYHPYIIMLYHFTIMLFHKDYLYIPLYIKSI